MGLDEAGQQQAASPVDRFNAARSGRASYRSNAILLDQNVAFEYLIHPVERYDGRAFYEQ